MIEGRTNSINDGYKDGDVIICIYKNCELPDVFKVKTKHHHYFADMFRTIDVGIGVIQTSTASPWWQARTFCVESVSSLLDMLKPDALRILVQRKDKIIYEWNGEKK